MIPLLKLKYCNHDNTWLLYNTDNPLLHTHCRHKRVALKIKKAVEHKEVPDTNDKRVIESCMRLTRNRRYLEMLEGAIHNV